MLISEYKFGKTYMVWQKEAFWWKVEHVKAHRTKKRTETDVAV